MKILYIYPHPDDESFGPGQVMSYHRRHGHDVYLLTLTKGGATKMRHKFGYSVEEMGEVRHKEMLDVAKVLDISGMTVLDLPDSGLKEMDPRDIEKSIIAEIEKIQPQVIVSYAVDGVSGFHDHLITHAVVKRVFVSLREKTTYLKRFAMITLTEEEASLQTHFLLHFSRPEDIDCIVHVDDIDIEKCHDALDCYVTYKEITQQTQIKEHKSKEVSFEIYQENFNTPLKDLFDDLL